MGWGTQNSQRRKANKVLRGGKKRRGHGQGRKVCKGLEVSPGSWKYWLQFGVYN